MVTYGVSADARGRIGVQVSGTARDLVILQFFALLQVVGVENIHACQAPDCPRIFVKTYRRDFCSAKCQTRTNKRKQRANNAAKRASSSMSHVLLLATESLPRPTATPDSTKFANGARP